MTEKYLELYFRIRKLLEEIELETRDNPKIEREARRMQLANDYLSLGEREKCMFELEKAVAEWELDEIQVLQTPVEMQMLMTLMYMYVSLKRYEKVRSCFGSILSYMERNRAKIPPVILDAGQCYMAAIDAIYNGESWNSKEGIPYLIELERLYRKDSDGMFPVDLYISANEMYSYLYVRLGQMEDAVSTYRDTINLAKECGKEFRQMGNLAQLATVYEGMGEYDLATETYREYQELRNELYKDRDEAYLQYLAILRERE